MGGSTPASPPATVERIGRYEVVLPLASGGMGTVYLARSHALGGFSRQVAVKLMHPHLRNEAMFAADLIDEARIAGQIRHPNVVPVLDVGDDQHGLYLVMEYVEGDSLSGLVMAGRAQGQSMPVRVGMRILVDALAGLHAAHELCDDEGQLIGLVHRDFSPQNLMVSTEGQTQLTDFGVAKARTKLQTTADGLVKGKARYMSPEHALGEPVDRRCDVWAAGVIAWEILAGRRLVQAEHDLGAILKVLKERPKRLRDLKPDISPALDEVVHHALTTELDDRCPTAKRFAEQLGAAARAADLLADSDEVARFVRNVMGDALQQRRSEAAAVLLARRSERPPPMAAGSVPLPARSEDEQTLPRHTSSTRPPPLPLPSPRPSDELPTQVRQAAKPAEVGGPEEVTGTHGVTVGQDGEADALLVPAEPAGRSVKVVLALVALAAAGLGGWLLLAGGEPTEQASPAASGERAQATPPPSQTSEPPSSLAASSAAASAAAVSNAASSAAASASPTGSTHSSATPTPSAPQPPRFNPGVRPGKPRLPQLGPNPYETP